MMLVKYVMIDRVHPVLFRHPVQHRAVKDVGVITSAGFFMVFGGEVTTDGESLTLGGMKPAPEDAAIIQRFLKDGGLL